MAADAQAVGTVERKGQGTLHHGQRSLGKLLHGTAPSLPACFADDPAFSGREEDVPSLGIALTAVAPIHGRSVTGEGEEARFKDDSQAGRVAAAVHVPQENGGKLKDVGRGFALAGQGRRQGADVKCRDETVEVRPYGGPDLVAVEGV